MLLWKKELDLNVLCYTRNFINFEVKDGLHQWRGTGLYGWPSHQDKHQTWKLMRFLNGYSNQPWLCFGDFNEVLYSFEKKGGHIGNVAEMDAF